MAAGVKEYRFGEFRLDPAARTLERSGEAIQIETRVFELLVYLLGNRGRTVSRLELTKALWGDVKVSDGSLRRTVSLLRKALDARGPSGTALETVHGRGYRFAADVEEGRGDSASGSDGATSQGRPSPEFQANGSARASSLDAGPGDSSYRELEAISAM